jgi:hypothetical protein
MKFDYESWLKTAQDRLEALYHQKSAIETEISALEEGIKGFAPLVNQPALWRGPDVGITDAVSNILKAEPNKLFSAIDVRDELVKRGAGLSQKNPLATIYQVLARLVEKGAVIIMAHEPGKNRYKWVQGWEVKKYRRSETETKKK